MLFELKLKKVLLLPCLLLFVFIGHTQSYRNIGGWSTEINQKIESFLNSTLIIKERKVAVFDCDGTLFGQTPYYLADEAIYSYAKDKFAARSDSLSLAKMAIINNLIQGNNVGVDYVKNRIGFLSGLSPEEIETIGENYFRAKYQTKFYPEMRELLANLQEYGFEIWVLTASPEILYQKFVSENLGIPENRILGVKSVISQGKVTDKIVYPIPQDKGKAEAIQTFIKARPLFVGGNSRGDLEMMNESIGIKMIVNPDDGKVEKGLHAGAMEGHTVKEYWDRHNGLAVYCKDVPEGSYHYVSEEMNIKPNKVNPITK
ncbi:MULTISPECIES: HAD family phosphatase [unclassified Arenibacter]|uniref:HAD family hydrolase n=1 Tax=unclassified Arenibacter TaxID=2615047 RepID=UPI000E34D08D|nr:MULTISPECIES: haloacid dehalogenase-like hydrolase [unclassified Arenibacter]MCM4162337.1 haloacid dehalogenase-like hydrolase [Arenibacter sp. A80]RFT57935.1 haloacid dehalogenase-like hydrolase [Arenibacter sp. P308M17]